MFGIELAIIFPFNLGTMKEILANIASTALTDAVARLIIRCLVIIKKCCCIGRNSSHRSGLNRLLADQRQRRCHRQRNRNGHQDGKQPSRYCLSFVHFITSLSCYCFVKLLLLTKQSVTGNDCLHHVVHSTLLFLPSSLLNMPRMYWRN